MANTNFLQAARSCHYDNLLLQARHYYKLEIEQLEVSGTNKHSRKCQEYRRIAEELLQKFEAQFDGGTSVQNYTIADNAVGYSYSKIFDNYLNYEVDEIAIEEPYLLLPHQIRNLRTFFNLLTSKCTNLRFIQLTTRSLPADIYKDLTEKLQRYNITLAIYFNPQSHLRVIMLSNGYRIKIDYGLDIYKKWEPTDGKGGLDKRRCKKTTVEVTKKRSQLATVLGVLKRWFLD